MEELSCDSNNITKLNLDNNRLLRVVTCSDNEDLDTLDVQNNTELARLEIDDTAITSLYLERNTKLCNLSCVGTEIEMLDVSMCDPKIEVKADDSTKVIRKKDLP